MRSELELVPSPKVDFLILSVFLAGSSPLGFEGLDVNSEGPGKTRLLPFFGNSRFGWLTVVGQVFVRRGWNGRFVYGTIEWDEAGSDDGFVTFLN